MNPTVSRGRLIFMIAVALLIVERLALAGLALANYNHPSFNWTAVILPLTHIAVVLFLPRGLQGLGSAVANLFSKRGGQ